MTSSASEIKGSKYSKLDDNELLTLIGENRDRAALTELYNRYRLPLGHFIQREMSGTKLVEEVYNDVMLIVWNKASGFRGDSKVSTWIFGIAYRTRLTHSRKESRHNHCGTGEFMDNVQIEDESDLEARTSVSETLHAAMIELPSKHRVVIELAYFHGYSTAEIAGIVGCPQNTVKTRLFHARNKLKATLEAGQAVEQSSDSYESPSPKRKKNSFFPDAIDFSHVGGALTA
jgi:RNA polymerase sigma-70 factor (ECF subfamily)